MSDAPPSYEAATSSTGASAAQHRARNGIPAERRRSMEDEARPLPAGWVRQYDSQNEHQFFVDTHADPPRSIWHHPFDDEQYLSTLAPDERENVTRLHHSISLQDIAAESSGSDDDNDHNKQNKKAAAAAGKSSGSNDAGEVHGLHKLGRRIKDRVTHTDHQQRVAEREKRAERERQAYAAHLAARRALSRAIETGEPQFLCKDRDGKDVYIVPPPGISQLRQPFPSGAYGYNPYNNGPFANPGARYLRPQTPYSRPYGYGYGGGYGFPLMGGFLGGAMLGSLMF
ncbi:ww rsp5 wwp protein [Diplodia corticola]|uniref:Ww rsp5 wwp protein n=1 Tax=Diplodia corticola TaxID=236234 RepID=A0A1J9QQW2_9PEZI|nr:ww rsp5 wwp protein [Diplodia corticola]OJD30817.1 ww rsp5 wwp protein [Diplodia corticola]